MTGVATTYLPALASLAAAGLLLVVQLLVADLAGIRAGHRPGHAVTPDDGPFLFRAVRAHANLNESIAGFIAVTVAAVALEAAPWAVNAFALVYLAGRIGHAAAYYADRNLARPVAFAIGLVGIVGVGAAALVAAATA